MKSLHGYKQTLINYVVKLNQITSNQNKTKLQINPSPNHTPKQEEIHDGILTTSFNIFYTHT
jgi:hypothetical protein